MLLLGIDLGTSSIKVSVVDENNNCLHSVTYPEKETDILSSQPGWAEQSADLWWENVQQAILKLNSARLYDPDKIAAIGIAYQMHGLVLTDKNQQTLRNSIIWCDSRAVQNGNEAFENIGNDYCLRHLLNSPGNFTAAKLAWVKQHEPDVYARIDKVMLPGDFIAMKLTGEITSTPSSLSEGIFWDFPDHRISKKVLEYFDFPDHFFAATQPVFSEHGKLSVSVAERLSLKKGIPVTYKAGDQLNNAVALNVFNPGEVAATAGTSGVIYGITERLQPDARSRVNSFAHVNHRENNNRVGVLLCINGTGIFNRWIREMFGNQSSYDALNLMAENIAPGADGLLAMPFGNGAERMLDNRIAGAGFHHLDFNTHSTGHLVRSAQEGIAFAFRYGLDIMKENAMQPGVIRAGKTNMFLSNVFTGSFVNATGIPVEFYQTDGSCGAATGAGIGLGLFTETDLKMKIKCSGIVEPTRQKEYEELYGRWKYVLDTQLDKYQS